MLTSSNVSEFTARSSDNLPRVNKVFSSISFVRSCRSSDLLRFSDKVIENDVSIQEMLICLDSPIGSVVSGSCVY